MKGSDEFPELNLFLADDDKDDRLLFHEVLEELQLQIKLTAIQDGEQLMLLLKKKSENLPDALFLDLNMPRKSGHTCLEEIKCDPKLKQLPVIIFSTSFEERVADILYKNGAQYYICKPAAFSHLKKVIQQALTLVSEKNISQPARENFLLSIL